MAEQSFTPTSPGRDQNREQQSHSSTSSQEQSSQAIVVHPQRQHSNPLWRWPYVFATAGLAIILSPLAWWSQAEVPIDPSNYALRTQRVLKTTPLIDGHNDLPWILRVELHNRLHDKDKKFDPHQRLLGHTDITRLKEGKVGGQFWSVYVHCDASQKHFEDPSWIVRDTLEQIDVAKRFISEYPNVFTYCTTSECVRKAFKSGRIASMLGIEGGHQLGGSIASIRQAYDLGVRYITTTHNCDNAWATSASTVAAQGPEADHGLTAFGAAYVRETNRLGMMLDLSHVSHQTMRDVLSLAQAPVIFSHSGAYSVEPHLRNVPDDVLRSVRKNGGIVMAVFVNRFLKMQDPSSATIHDVVDHIFHLAEVAGWEHVGLGWDFSGTPYTPAGLEDVSKFPRLIELVMARGATDEQVRLLVGDNLIRVWGDIERRAREIQVEGGGVVEDEWEGRKWHHAYKSSPYMFRETRERAVRENWGEPHQFSVGRDGKHKGLKSEEHV